MFATRTREKSVVHSEVLLFLISIFCRHLQLFFVSLHRWRVLSCFTRLQQQTMGPAFHLRF